MKHYFLANPSEEMWKKLEVADIVFSWMRQNDAEGICFKEIFLNQALFALGATKIIRQEPTSDPDIFAISLDFGPADTDDIPPEEEEDYEYEPEEEGDVLQEGEADDQPAEAAAIPSELEIDLVGLGRSCDHWNVLAKNLRDWITEHLPQLGKVMISISTGYNAEAVREQLISDGLNLILGADIPGGHQDDTGATYYTSAAKKAIGFGFISNCPGNLELQHVICCLINLLPLVLLEKKKVAELKSLAEKVEFSGLKGQYFEHQLLARLAAGILCPVLGDRPLAIREVDGRREPEADGRFNICLNSSIQDGEKIALPRTLWELGLSHTKKAYPPTGQGLIISDPAGSALAELVDGDLYILFDLICQKDDYYYADRILLYHILTAAAKLLALTPAQKQKLLAEQKLRRQISVVDFQTSASQHFHRLKDKLLALLGRQLAPKIKQTEIVLHWPRDTYAQPPLHDGRFHFWFWAGSGSDARPRHGSGNRIPGRLWGLNTRSDDYNWNYFRSSKTGIEITEPDSGFAAAELVNDNNLYVLLPLYSEDIKDGCGIIEKIIEEVVLELAADAPTKAARLAERKARRKAATSEAYVAECLKRQRAETEQLRASIDANEKAVADLQKNLVSLIRTIKIDSQRLLGASGLGEEYLAKFQKEFEALWSMPGIENIAITDGIVSIYTEHIYITPEGYPDTFDIGKFRMEIRTDGAEHGLKFFNLTRQGKGSGISAYNVVHPHVHETGVPCLGNIKEVIPQLIAAYEFSVIAQLGLEFLKTVNVEDRAGQYIFTCWPKVEKQTEEVA